jgi:hypothetical protein
MPELADLLAGYMRTNRFAAEFARQRREYGNGLVKVEPGDLEQILVPDFSALDPASQAEAVRLERQIEAGLAGPELASVRDRLEQLFGAPTPV